MSEHLDRVEARKLAEVKRVEPPGDEAEGGVDDAWVQWVSIGPRRDLGPAFVRSDRLTLPAP